MVWLTRSTAQGIEISNSLVEEDKLDVAKALLEKINGKLILWLTQKEANAFADYTSERHWRWSSRPRFLVWISVLNQSSTRPRIDWCENSCMEWTYGCIWNPDPSWYTGMDAIVKQPGNQRMVAVTQLLLDWTWPCRQIPHGSHRWWCFYGTWRENPGLAAYRQQS